MTPHPKSQSLAETALYDLLDDQKIAWKTQEHEAVFTVEESAQIKSNLPGGHTKNLFLKDKAGQFVLVSAISDTVIKVNKLHGQIGTKRLSFGKAEALETHLGVKPGSVTLFSVLNDAQGAVKLVLDKALFNHDVVWFHPLRNTASTSISSADIVKFAEAAGHHPQIIDFTALLDG